MVKCWKPFTQEEIWKSAFRCSVFPSLSFEIWIYYAVRFSNSSFATSFGISSPIYMHINMSIFHPIKIYRKLFFMKI
jgi:hypothetical protein